MPDKLYLLHVQKDDGYYGRTLDHWVLYDQTKGIAIDFFDDTVLDLLPRDRLVISKIEKTDFQFVSRIQELDYKITDDDAFHLSCAINKRCQRFITIDRDLLNETFRVNIKREFGLIITSPT